MGAIHQALLMYGAAAGFSPGSIASLDWWLQGDTATISGVPEFDWPDSSTGNRPYGQNTSAREPSLVSGPNGHQLVRFGSNKCLVPDPTSRGFGTANTLIVVCSKSSSAEYIVKGNNLGGQGSPAFISKFNPGSGVKDFEYYNDRGSGNIERATFAASTDSNLHILTVTHTDDTGNYVGYFDGTQVFSNAVNTVTDWSGLACTIIGAFTAGSSNYGGDIAEILHFNAVLSGTDLTNVHDCLKSKYSIP